MNSCVIAQGLQPFLGETYIVISACTTIPIYREGLGLVGAVCINVDYNYLDEVVRNTLCQRHRPSNGTVPARVLLLE